MGLRDGGQSVIFEVIDMSYILIVVVFAFVKTFKMNVLTAYDTHLGKAYLRRKRSIKSKPK